MISIMSTIWYKKYIFFLFDFCILLLPETWKLYGNAVRWALCTAFDVHIFNLLWIDLQ